MSCGKVVWDEFDALKLDDCYAVMTQWNTQGHESQKRLGCRLKTRQKKPWMIHQEFMCSFPAKSIHVSRWCNRSTFPTLEAVNRLTAEFFPLREERTKKATDNEVFRAFIISWNENGCKHILWIIKHISRKKTQQTELSCNSLGGYGSAQKIAQQLFFSAMHFFLMNLIVVYFDCQCWCAFFFFVFGRRFFIGIDGKIWVLSLSEKIYGDNWITLNCSWWNECKVLLN